MDCSSRRKFSGKKVIPFEVLPFSGFYRNDRNFLYHLFGLPVEGFKSRERERKIYLYFVNGTTQSRSCFRYQKKSQYHLTEIFQRNFRTNGKLQLPCSFRAIFLNALSPLSWSLEEPRLKWVEKVGPRYLVILGVFFSATYY